MLKQDDFKKQIDAWNAKAPQTSRLPICCVGHLRYCLWSIDDDWGEFEYVRNAISSAAHCIEELIRDKDMLTVSSREKSKRIRELEAENERFSTFIKRWIAEEGSNHA